MSDERSIGSRMARAAFLVGGGVLVSRLLGLLRDIILADRLGDTPQGDAYDAAFLIPDYLNYLLAGGFLAITFIPIISRHIAARDEDAMWRSFAAVFRPLTLLITVLTVLGIVLAGPLVELAFGVAGGFDGAQIDDVAHLTRLVLPAQIFFVLGALFTAVQYAHEKFWIPTLAPVIYNLGIIIGGIVGSRPGQPDATGFIVGAVVGAFVGNFALQWWGARNLGLRWVRGVPLFGADFRDYFTLALPLMLGQSVVVLDESFTKVFGSLGDDGSVFALSRARRLNMLPVGLIAQAAGVAAYPFLARMAAEGRQRDMSSSVATAVRYVVFVGVGATALVLAVAQPGVRVALQRGAFTSEGTAVAAGALALYALSIPAWGAHQVYARGFYANRRMWVPVGVGTAWTVIAIPLFFAGYAWIAVPGLALASSVAVVGYAVTLAAIWHRSDPDGIRIVVASLGRSMAAAVPAGLSGWLVAGWVAGSEISTFWSSLAATALGTVVTAGLFVLLSSRLGGPEMASLFRRGRPRP
ncbi:MAG: hypothetical protein OEM97_04465 [Acidimicrobiia bacterium]|nr:hypothetical protein [Acidimicrobiia bacterium]